MTGCRSHSALTTAGGDTEARRRAVDGGEGGGGGVGRLGADRGCGLPVQREPRVPHRSFLVSGTAI